VTFLEAIRTCLVKYADFKGRATRPEFWQWIMFVAIVGLSLDVLSSKASTVFMLVTLVPTLAAAVRRLHDTDRSGWLLLVGLLIPIVGWILLIVSCAQEGRHPNRFESVIRAEA
jgi:uncharacterized membrane protein YhaH (DUF805 family)